MKQLSVLLVAGALIALGFFSIIWGIPDSPEPVSIKDIESPSASFDELEIEEISNLETEQGTESFNEE